MVDARETLHKLASFADELNEKSDELNEIIASIETKLGEMNLGVSVWIDDPEDKLFDPQSSFTLKIYSRDLSDARSQWDAAFLGYGRYEKQWRIGVRRYKVIEYLNDGSDSKQDCELLKSFPLAEAPRELRIKAIGALDRLFSALHERMDGMLDDIERGKRFVKKLA